MSTSSRSTRSNAANNNGSDSQASNSSTEEYEIPRVVPNNRNANRNLNPVVVIDQIPLPGEAAAAPIAINDEDDDVVLIPPEIETIDLCTQVAAAVVPVNLHNEIIDITDSPVQNQNAQPTARTRRSQNAENVTGPARGGRRGNARTSPYDRAGNSSSTPKQAEPSSSVPPVDLDDSSVANAIKYCCPICLESVKNRGPVSTMCGHVFCKACIQAAYQATKKCPMCKKNLSGKNPFIQIFID